MPTVSQHYARTRGAADARRYAGAPVVLMVSGGADSTALLIMACTGELDIDDGAGPARIALERLHVLHVNHHLRGSSSDGDERFVRGLCARFGVPLCVEHASFADLGGRNLEAAAREVRYAAARRYVRELSDAAGTPRAAARILTAHTATDRAETFFMNAIKGSGAAGLSSIPRRRNIIVRPLIDKTHAELVEYLEVRGESWREDESNADTGYLRNFVRHKVLPLALERNARAERTVSASCDILGDEDAFLSQLASTALRSCMRSRGEGFAIIDARRLAAADLAIARRMVRLAVSQIAPDARLEMRHVEAVLARVAAGSGSLTLPEGVDARVEFGVLGLRTPSARESISAGWLEVPGRMAVPGQRVLAAEVLRVVPGDDPIARARELAGTGAVLVDAEALGYSAHDLACALDRGAPSEASPSAPLSNAPSSGLRLWIDAPAPGDLMCPLGMSGRTKKVSDILNEARLPLGDRACVPVVRTAPAGAIVWLGGIRLDERFKCGAATRVLLKLSIRPVEVD